MTKMFCDKCGKSVPNDFYDNVVIEGKASGLGDDSRYVLCSGCSYWVKDFIEKDSDSPEMKARRNKRELKELILFFSGWIVALLVLVWLSLTM